MINDKQVNEAKLHLQLMETIVKYEKIKKEMVYLMEEITQLTEKLDMPMNKEEKETYEKVKKYTKKALGEFQK